MTYIDNVDDVTYIDNVDEMEDNWARGFVDVNLFKTCLLNYKYYLQLEQRHMYLCQEIVGNVLWFHLTTNVFIPVVHTRYCQTMSMPWLHTCLFK